MGIVSAAPTNLQKTFLANLLEGTVEIAYIAGPYRADTVAGIRRNIENARKVAEKYWKLGYAVFCPHLNSAFMDGICPDENFLEGGLEILKRCDVLVMVDGWMDSTGARAEHDMAMVEDMEIIYE